MTRLIKPVAIVLACALAGCQGTPTKPAAPIRLGAAQSGSLTVKLAPGAGLRTQYLAVQDWEVAEGTLENATLGIAPVTVQAQAVVDPTTQTRTAALSFTGITPGTGYTLTVRLKRQDAAGTALVVAEASKTALDLVVGPNAITWDQPLVPRLARESTATPAFSSYVSSLFGGAIAELKQPQGLAFAPDGRLFVSDTGNHRLRAMTFDGYGTSTAVIGTGTNSVTNGLGPSAEVNAPIGVAFNTAGDMFIADRDNNRIRKVTFDASGYPTVSTLAGGNAGFQDGNGSTATFDAPVALAFDGDGNLWVAERDNNAIRKIAFNLDGTVTVSTVAGTGAFGFSDGVAADAQFRNPQGIAYDPVHDHIIVADTGNNRIRVLHHHDVVPEIETVAGLDSSGFADGDSSTAKFGTPMGLAWGPDDCLYVADKDNHRIRRLTFASEVDVTVDTPAGTGSQGSANGAGTSATFKSPVDLAFNSDGELFVAESGNHLIRKLVFDGGNATVSTAAGIRSGSLDGPLTAPVGSLQDMAMGADGALYVSDTTNNRIAKVTFDGAGNATYAVLAGTTQASFANGNGATARFNGPRGIVAGAAGEFFIADTGNHRIRRLTIDGSGTVAVTTVAGSGTGTHADGDATTARFKGPQGICRDSAGNLFIADEGNHRIRKIVFNPDTSVTVSTVAGTGVAAFTDGDGAAARFNGPEAIAVGSDGTLYVADSNNHRVRAVRFGDGGTVTVSTLAGTGSTGAADGAGATATLNGPSGVEVEADGNLLIADDGNHKIRRITLGPEGAATVSTVAGSGTSGFADGPGNMAQFSGPEGLAIGPDGRIYVADTNKGVIRVIR